MYYRITNDFDCQVLTAAFKDKVPDCVLNAIANKISVLEEFYNSTQEFKDYGNCVIFFPTEQVFQDVYEKFLDYYKVEDTMDEYCDILTEENDFVWKEKLFMIGTETGYALIYPERR